MRRRVLVDLRVVRTSTKFSSGIVRWIEHNPSAIFRTVHIPWKAWTDPLPLAEEAAAFGETGVNKTTLDM
jgi:hypothetical protein